MLTIVRDAMKVFFQSSFRTAHLHKIASKYCAHEGLHVRCNGTTTREAVAQTSTHHGRHFLENHLLEKGGLAALCAIANTCTHNEVN